MQFVMVAAAVMSAVGAISKGNAANEQYQAYAQANEYNAAVSRQRAEATGAIYNEREEQSRREARLKLGSLRAGMAQSGLGLGGSSADLENQSEVFAELDALNIRYEGTLKQKGMLDDANLQDAEAAGNRRAGKNAQSAGYMGAVSAALGGAGDYAKFGGGGSGGPRIAGNSTYGLNGNYPVMG